MSEAKDDFILGENKVAQKSRKNCRYNFMAIY